MTAKDNDHFHAKAALPQEEDGPVFDTGLSDAPKSQPRMQPGGGKSITAAYAPSGMMFGNWKFNRNQTVAVCVTIIASAGILLGIFVEGPSENPPPYDKISSIVGWFYFSAWTFSFLPQIYLNWRRQSVVGQSFEFVYLNIMGYAAYFVYNSCLYFVASVRKDYAAIFHHENNVQINDICYALFAVTCCCWNAWQIAVYDRGNQKPNRIILSIIGLVASVFTLWGLIIVAFGVRSHTYGPLGYLYMLSLVKFFVTLTKYMPQILLNMRRRLTLGWNIWNVFLDFTGGVLSVTQEVFDAAVTDHWNGLIGNPIKIALGIISSSYNAVFMFQHFYLYRRTNRAVIAAIKAELAGDAENAADAIADDAVDLIVPDEMQIIMAACRGGNENVILVYEDAM